MGSADLLKRFRGAEKRKAYRRRGEFQSVPEARFGGFRTQRENPRVQIGACRTLESGVERIRNRLGVDEAGRRT